MPLDEIPLATKLREAARGRVLDDDSALLRFSRDQSIYEIKPQAVVFPEDREDVQRIAEFARREGVPITPRGGGSGTAGSALGAGIVIALPDSEYWGRISGFSETGDSATVSAGAGAYHNELQIFLKGLGFFLPADVTSAAISRIGGNIATKASGPHALRYGSIDRFLEHLEFITANGEFVDTSDETTIPERLRRNLSDLSNRIRSDDAARGILEARREMKTASGYNLFAFLDNPGIGRLIAQLFTGSVGTLGIVTGATVRGVKDEPERAGLLLSFEDLAETGRAVCALRERDVAAIELINRDTVRLIREQTPLPELPAMDAHLLFVELIGPELPARIENITALIKQQGYRMRAPAVIASGEKLDALWNMRKQILWLTQRPRPGRRALGVANDVGVPPARLPEFIGAVQKVFDTQGIPAFIYGHAGNGNLHLRPLFDVTLPDLRGRIRRLVDDIYDTVFRYGGTITSEHGMGRLRAPYLKREWGETLYGYMREVKTIFDPRDLLNPGVMFGDKPITDHMRPDLLLP